jgi:hypothetical protein
VTFDSTLITQFSGLIGALIGGAASLLAAIYTQRNQHRLQRVADEVAKRESVYSDFVMHASNLLLTAYTQDEIILTGDQQRLLGLVNRMRFFAPRTIVDAAEAVIRTIMAIALKPGVELRQLAMEAVASTFDLDPLRSFSEMCRADLDNVRRTMA